jgi:hypothetical protein
VVVSLHRSGSTTWSVPRVVWHESKRLPLDVNTLSLDVTPAGFAVVGLSAGVAGDGNRTYGIVGDLARASWTRPRVVHRGISWATAVSDPAQAVVAVRDHSGVSVIDASLTTNSWQEGGAFANLRSVAGIDLAANTKGDAIVAWTRCPGGTHYPCKLGRSSSFLTSSRPAGGAWDHPQTLERGEGGDGPLCRSIGLDGQDNATVAWLEDAGFDLVAARRALGGGWSRVSLATNEIGFGCRSLRTAIAARTTTMKLVPARDGGGD